MRVEEMKQQAAPVPDIRAGAHSAKGLREENQDAMTRFQSRFGEVVLVADGMGGHQGGATASDMVAKRFAFHLQALAENTISVTDALQQAATRVNDEIYERGHSGDAAIAGMGSTLVVAVIRSSVTGREAIVANAGDSRCYLLRDGVLRQLTRDHTAAQRMVDAGILTQEGARSHPNASVLTRALGQQLGTTAEVYPPVTLQPGDGLLLCSDGLSGYATDDVITRAIDGGADPSTVVRNLIELALHSGSDDNITVQYLRFGDRPMAAQIPPVSATPVRQGAPRWLLVLAILTGMLAVAGAGLYTYRKFWPKPAAGHEKPVAGHDKKETSQTGHDHHVNHGEGAPAPHTGGDLHPNTPGGDTHHATPTPEMPAPELPPQTAQPATEPGGQPAAQPRSPGTSGGGESSGPPPGQPHNDKSEHKKRTTVEILLQFGGDPPAWLRKIVHRLSANSGGTSTC